MSARFLPGAEKYYSAAVAKQQSQRGMSATELLIERANEVSIFDVLRDFFNLHLPREGRSFKSYCPFAEEHPDGGLDKGWRTYPATNSSMCFPLHGYMPPVRLIQIKYRERAGKSAERILRSYDLLKPRHWRDRYTELAHSKEHQPHEVVGNPQHAVGALNYALRTHPDYAVKQFNPEIMAAMEIVLDALDQSVSTGDPEQVREWFIKAKAAMLRKLGEVQ